MILFIMFNVQKVSAQKTVLEKRDKGFQKEYLTIMHSLKSVHIWSYSASHFLAFGLNSERYRVSLHIQFKCRKMRTRISPNTDTFLHSDGRDAKSHLVKHANKKCHKYLKIDNFNVLAKGYRNNTFKLKVAESLLIKNVRPTLSTHEKCVSLKLFN